MSLPYVCFAAAPKGGLPSWDTPSLPPQAPQLQLHPSAPQTHSSLRDSTQSSWQDSKATTVPSWQKSSSSSMTAVSSQRDPFAGLPPPQPAATHQGPANDRISDALFGSLSAGKLFYQTCHVASHPFHNKPKMLKLLSHKLGCKNKSGAALHRLCSCSSF